MIFKTVFDSYFFYLSCDISTMQTGFYPIQMIATLSYVPRLGNMKYYQTSVKCSILKNIDWASVSVEA